VKGSPEVPNALRTWQLLVSLAVLLAFVIVVALALRESGERERFVGHPCQESSAEQTPAELLSSVAPAGVGEAPNPLPSPARAVTGEHPMRGREAALAKRYEPILAVAKVDRFWPVPVPTIFDLTLEGRYTRFVSPTRASEHAQLGDLRPNGRSEAYLDYPAGIDDVEDEFCSVGHALHIPAGDLAQWDSNSDLLHPGKSAEFYFLDRPSAQGGKDLQYWFFYPMNYLPTLTNDHLFLQNPVAAIYANADFHEGDFEHITVQLRPTSAGLEPRAVRMARHSGEDKTIAWDSTSELQREGDHPIVYAGFGGHASYNKCGMQVRHAEGFLPLRDWALCGSESTFTFGPETPLVNLRRVSWACWPGHFGEVPAEHIPQLFVDGPRSPDFQGDNKDVVRALCPGH
jgi:Vacuolar protein sorting-associated protein 62